ncbi:MAG: response regulator transcription factor [Actinomycetota bacterium]
MRVVIVEDSVLLREGLARLLEDEGIEVCSALGDTTGLMAAVAADEPDLAVLDVRLPPSFVDEGLRAAAELRAARPAFPVLVLSQYVEERYAADLIRSDARAVGYLLKERVADVAEFVDAVRRVAAGATVIDPEVVGQLLARRGPGPIEQLTPREREVLDLVAQGRSNGAIADALVVSAGAVEKHIANIFTKLDLPPASEDHRRVLAVLSYLQATR